jgi:putative ABC transport system substrate-binding protein
MRATWPIVMMLCATGLLAAPLGAEAQQAGRVPRVGFLWTGSPELTTRALDAFRQGLREAGYIEGRNIAIEHRWAADVVQRLPDLASELVRSKVDIVVTQGTPAAEAAKRVTTTVPIVMAISGDAMATGLVASLAHPGGNITGLTLLPELIGKRLELLKEAIPTASRVAVIVDPTATAPGGTTLGLRETEAAARALGSRLQILEVRGRGDFEKAFEAATKARAEALVVSASPILRFHLKPFVDLAAKHRLPAMYQRREFVEAADSWLTDHAMPTSSIELPPTSTRF